MRIFKNTWFTRFAKRQRIDDEALVKAVDRAINGLVDADLGGNVIKQRIARRNEGRSGGYRVIILLRVADLAFFIYGFAKSEKANVSSDDVDGFRELAEAMLALDDKQLEAAKATGILSEVILDAQEIQE